MVDYIENKRFMISVDENIRILNNNAINEYISYIQKEIICENEFINLYGYVDVLKTERFYSTIKKKDLSGKERSSFIFRKFILIDNIKLTMDEFIKFDPTKKEGEGSFSLKSINIKLGHDGEEINEILNDK